MPGCQPYSLSDQESILLGLLEKDFSSVTACKASRVIDTIKAVNLLLLPRSLSGLYPILEQLQAIGTLLILGGEVQDSYLVLNIPQLMNEVHEKLFSKGVLAIGLTGDFSSYIIDYLAQLQSVC